MHTNDCSALSINLRAPPSNFVGQDEIKTDIVQKLLYSEPKSVLILGGGGMGKTALALTVLHEQDIIGHFGDSRCFISCEGLDNMDLFFQRLAEILGIATSDTKASLEHQILSVLSSSDILLCIDNLETIWDSSQKYQMELLLAKLIKQHSVAVLVTMRGTEHPYEPIWAKIHELQPLTQSLSFQVFCSAAGIAVDEIDKYGKALVEAVDGVPLALTLLGYLIQPGKDLSRDVWKKWEKQKTAILSREKGYRDPHLSINTSIEFSLASQRVKADPFAKTMLGILSLLPDGLPRDSDLDIINHLASYLPDNPDVQKSLSTLTDAALAFVESTSSRRYQILSPVREFALSQLDSLLDHGQQTKLVHYFICFIQVNRDYTMPHCFPAKDELVNMHSLLSFAYSRREQLSKDIITDYDLAHSSIDYTDWTIYMGAPVEDIIYLAEKEFFTADLLAEIYFTHGRLHMQRDRLDDAGKAFTDALELHKQVQDSLGQANVLQNLGELHMRLDRLDSAEKASTDALDIYKQVQSALGQANVLQNLGELHMRLDRFDSAEKAFIDALELHKQVQDSVGQAYDLQKLGELHMRPERVDSAEKAFTDAQ